METTIQVLKGFDPKTNQPIYEEVSVLACAGFTDIDPNHIKIHKDPNQSKRTRKTDNSAQIEIPLD